MNTLAFKKLETLRHTAEGAEVARAGLNNIHVGLNVTVRITRDRTERERDAIRWLAAYILRDKLTTDEACKQLDAEVVDIRAALTNPEADVRALVGKIQSLRSVLEMNLRAPAETQDRLDIEEAFDFAQENGALVEFIALTRTGKTTVADWLHCQNLGRAVLVDCTSAESYAAFIECVARGCGISLSRAHKGKGVEKLEAAIEAMLGAGGIGTLIIDEGHYLWPTNIKLKPKRIEYVRKLWDRMKRKLAIFILSTPQSVLSSNQALGSEQERGNKRWSPGQWEGRINRYFPSRDKASDADIAAVARWHCPEGSQAVIDLMVRHAKASPGFYGAMTNALDRARHKARRSGEKFTLKHLADAQLDSIAAPSSASRRRGKGWRNERQNLRQRSALHASGRRNRRVRQRKIRNGDAHSSGIPIIRNLRTGKWFVLPWEDILSLAEEAGISNPDAVEAKKGATK